MAKHKPPSRERYEQNNPNWTVRLTMDLFIALQDFLEKTGYSRQSFISMALGKMKMDFEKFWSEGYNEGIEDGERNGYSMGESEGFNEGCQIGFDEGYKKGDKEGYTRGLAEGLDRGRQEGYNEGAEEMYQKLKDRNKIWYYCAACGIQIDIVPNSPEHQFIINMMLSNGWKHPDCNFQWDPYL